MVDPFPELLCSCPLTTPRFGNFSLGPGLSVLTLWLSVVRLYRDDSCRNHRDKMRQRQPKDSIENDDLLNGMPCCDLDERKMII